VRGVVPLHDDAVHGAVDIECHGRAILDVDDLGALLHLHPLAVVPVEVRPSGVDALGEHVDVVAKAGGRSP